MFSKWSGRCLAYLGRTDEALAFLGQALATPTSNVRRPAAVQADIALAYAVAVQREPMREAAHSCIDACKATGYRVGVDRIRRVRDLLPSECATLACVREFDKRLHLAA